MPYPMEFRIAVAAVGSRSSVAEIRSSAAEFQHAGAEPIRIIGDAFPGAENRRLIVAGGSWPLVLGPSVLRYAARTSTSPEVGRRRLLEFASRNRQLKEKRPPKHVVLRLLFFRIPDSAQLFGIFVTTGCVNAGTVPDRSSRNATRRWTTSSGVADSASR